MKKISLIMLFIALFSFCFTPLAVTYADSTHDEFIQLKPNEEYDLENNRIVENYALKDTVMPKSTALEIAAIGSIASFIAANPLVSLSVLLLGLAAVAVGVRFKNYFEVYDFGKKVKELLSDVQFAAAISGNNIVYTAALLYAIQSVRYRATSTIESDSINKYVRYHDTYFDRLDIKNLLDVDSVFISKSKEGIYDNCFYTKNITIDVTRSTGFSESEIKELTNNFANRFISAALYCTHYDVESDYLIFEGNSCIVGQISKIANGYRLYITSEMLKKDNVFLTNFKVGNYPGAFTNFVGVDVLITLSTGKTIKLNGDVSPDNQFYKMNTTKSANIESGNYSINTNAIPNTATVDADTFKSVIVSGNADSEATLIARPYYLDNVTDYSTTIDVPVDDTAEGEGTGENTGENTEEGENSNLGWLSKIYHLLELLLNGIKKAVDNIKDFVESIGDFVQRIADFVVSIPHEIALAFDGVLNNISEFVRSIANSIADILEWLKDFFVPDFSAIKATIASLNQKIHSKFSFLNDLLNNFKSIFSSQKSIYDLDFNIMNQNIHPFPKSFKPAIDNFKVVLNVLVILASCVVVYKRLTGSDGDVIAT